MRSQTPRELRLTIPGNNSTNLEITVQLLNRQSVTTTTGLQFQNYQSSDQMTADGTYSAGLLRSAGALKVIGILVSALILLLVALLLVLNRLYLMYHLLEYSQSIFLLLLLNIEYSPSLAEFMDGMRYVHLWFLNFNLVPASFLTFSSARFYLYVTDATFLRNVMMDFIIGVVVLLLGLVLLLTRRLILRVHPIDPEQDDTQQPIARHEGR